MSRQGPELEIIARFWVIGYCNIVATSCFKPDDEIVLKTGCATSCLVVQFEGELRNFGTAFS